MEKKELYLIKTDKGCFLSDCKTENGYNYDYHNSIVPDLYFDGLKAKESHCKNWYYIESFPKKIEQMTADERVNTRYELIDKTMECEKLPNIIKTLDSEDNRYDLYKYKYDTKKGDFKKFDGETCLLLEIENYSFPPSFEYNTVQNINYKDVLVKITNKNIKHPMLNRVIIPEIMLHNSPCKISSVDLYKIVRNHVKENIDHKMSKITSDYNFCFTVKKIVPLYKPRDFTYTNPFARTKRQRSKIHHGIQEYKEYHIFSMTDDKQNYRGYSPIESISANNEEELKIKIDSYLEQLMETINKPLKCCEHCKGAGFLDDFVK